MATRRGTNEFSSSSSSSVDEDGKDQNIPDVSSVDQSREKNSRMNDEPRSSAGIDLPRREENTLSFKHFLSNDTRINYNLAGARPKVYTSMRRKTPDNVQNARVPEKDSVYPRNPTELPDFVQDHLVMEQCYLNNDAASPGSSSIADVSAASTSATGTLLVSDEHPLSKDMDNLPDFTLTGVFDLTGGLERRKKEKHCTGGNVNHDGPNLTLFGSRPNRLTIKQLDPLGRIADTEGLPFDLPPVAMLEPRIHNEENRADSRSSPANEASVNKSLPDFLNDGPIRNRVSAPVSIESTSSLDNFTSEHSDVSLLSENERLWNELKIARRQIAEGARTIESLKAELISRRQVDHAETVHLEQIEANLKQSTLRAQKRAASAEKTVTLLRQQVKALTVSASREKALIEHLNKCEHGLQAEVAILRAENQQYAGVAGGGRCTVDYRTQSTETRIKKLSDELRAAASSAEASLRQLMSGVDNLKVLASAIENVDRIEDRTKDFLPDFEEENAVGPAL